MQDYFAAQIRDHEQRLETLKGDLESLRSQVERAERQEIALEAALKAYRDALAHLPVSPVAKRARSGAIRTRVRALSSVWQSMLAFAASRHPHTVTYENFAEFADAQGFKISRENLRSQLSGYANRGLLERVGNGLYRITDDGAKEAGVTLSKAPKSGANDARLEQTESAASAYDEGYSGGYGETPRASPTVHTPARNVTQDLDDEIPF